MDKGKQHAERRRRASPAAKNRRIVTPEVRLKAVKLYLEEGMPAPLIGREVGVNQSAVLKWVKRYRERGEDGLKDKFPGKRRKVVVIAISGPDIGLRRQTWAAGYPWWVEWTAMHQDGLLQYGILRSRLVEFGNKEGSWKTVSDSETPASSPAPSAAEPD